MKLCLKNKHNNGFTLIEVLLAVAILGILSISMMSFFSQSYQYTKNNESKTVGINVARNVLNYIERQEFSKMKDLTPSTFTSDTCPSDVLIGCSDVLKTTVNDVNYEATVSLSPHTDAELENLLIAVEVNIKWNEKSTSVKGVIKK